ncbi:MAG: hypothetical protein OCD01_04170 [Fibrobacterales bacterium]
MKLIIILTTAVFVMIAGASVPQKALIDQYDPSYGWDWNDHDWWNALNEHITSIEIPKPTVPENFHSVFSTNENKMTKGDGWLLYTRRLLESDSRGYQNYFFDYGLEENEPYEHPYNFETLGTKLNASVKYYALYNKYTGVLRFFIFNEFDPADFQTLNHALGLEINGATYSSHRFFSTSADNYYPKNYASYGHVVKGPIPAEYELLNSANLQKKWLIVDVPLDYNNDNLSAGEVDFKLTTQKVRVDKINLNGTIVTEEEVPKNDGGFFGSLVGAAAKGALNYFAPVIGGYAGQEIVDQFTGMFFNENSCYDDPMLEAMQVKLESSTSDKLASNIKDLDLVSKVTNRGGSTEIVFKESKVNLSGEITNDSETSLRVSMPVIGSKFENEADVPYLAKSKEVSQLGLFYFNNPPKATLFGRKGGGIHELHIEDFTKCGNLVINPESGNELVDYNANISLTASTSHSYMQDGHFGPIYTTDYGTLISNSSNFLSPSQWRSIPLYSPTATNITSPKMTMKVYLKFRYTDGYGQVKYNEFVQSYDVNVSVSMVDPNGVQPYKYEFCAEQHNRLQAGLDNYSMTFWSDWPVYYDLNTEATGGDALYNVGYIGVVDAYADNVYYPDTWRITHALDEQNVYTSINGPGTLKFSWALGEGEKIAMNGYMPVSSAQLKLYVDDVEVELTSLPSDWMHEEIGIESGVHTIRWAMGSALLDHVTWQPINIVPTIITPLLLN